MDWRGSLVWCSPIDEHKRWGSSEAMLVKFSHKGDQIDGHTRCISPRSSYATTFEATTYPDNVIPVVYQVTWKDSGNVDPRTGARIFFRIRAERKE